MANYVALNLCHYGMQTVCMHFYKLVALLSSCKLFLSLHVTLFTAIPTLLLEWSTNDAKNFYVSVTNINMGKCSINN